MTARTDIGPVGSDAEAPVAWGWTATEQLFRDPRLTAYRRAQAMSYLAVSFGETRRPAVEGSPLD